DGEILVEVSEAVRESLIEAMDSAELVAAAETLEADELADIAADLPAGVMEEVVQSLPLEERERLRAALSYPEGSVGALMDVDHVRALRPRVGAGGRCHRHAHRATDRQRRGGPHPRAQRGVKAGGSRPAAGRGRIRAGPQQLQEPLVLASGQPGDRFHCLARDR